MPHVESSAIILCGEGPAPLADLQQALEGAGFVIRLHFLTDGQSVNSAMATAILIDGRRRMNEALNLCQRLRNEAGDSFTPILYIAADASHRARLACLQRGADMCLLSPFEPAELRAQVQAWVRIKQRHDALGMKAAEVDRINKRLQTAQQQINMELDLARRIQESFLPHRLPELPRVRFAVKYKPCGRVGGDFYDVFRLDEQHVGFYVADAMGHGVPASLLTIFVKTGVRAKEISGKDYHLVPPNEVLERLNRELLAQSLSENPFITMSYVLFNMENGALQFARAGHPYPLYLPREGPAVLWQIEGSLLGVFDVRYRLDSRVLKAGDMMLLYTDGMDSARFGNQPAGLASLLAAAEHYRDLGVRDLVDRLALDLFEQGRQADDLTIFGMEVVG